MKPLDYFSTRGIGRVRGNLRLALWAKLKISRR